MVLFFDGHHSHLSLKLITTAKKHNIWLYCLPPNTTHVFQPLDLGVFGPTKAAWKSIMKTYKVQTRAASIAKEVFPCLLNTLCSKAFTASHFQSVYFSRMWPLPMVQNIYPRLQSCPINAVCNFQITHCHRRNTTSYRVASLPFWTTTFVHTTSQHLPSDNASKSTILERH